MYGRRLKCFELFFCSSFACVKMRSSQNKHFLPLCQWVPLRVHPSALICQLDSRMSAIRRASRNHAGASVILRSRHNFSCIPLSGQMHNKGRLEWMTYRVFGIKHWILWNLITDANTYLPATLLGMHCHIEQHRLIGNMCNSLHFCKPKKHTVLVFNCSFNVNWML